jgi:hypothetical protein
VRSLCAVMHFRAPLPKVKRKIHLYGLPFDSEKKKE